MHRFFLHQLQLSRPHSRFSVRSALTDTPVASFTTLPLRATQHATGLMVKVAPLLPSRDLLSSHSQLGWTHTRVFCNWGTTWSNRQQFTISFGFGSTNKARQKFLTSNSKQNRAAVPGGTIFKSPTCSNTCTVCNFLNPLLT